MGNAITKEVELRAAQLPTPESMGLTDLSISEQFSLLITAFSTYVEGLRNAYQQLGQLSHDRYFQLETEARKILVQSVELISKRNEQAAQRDHSFPVIRQYTVESILSAPCVQVDLNTPEKVLFVREFFSSHASVVR